MPSLTTFTAAIGLAAVLAFAAPSSAGDIRPFIEAHVAKTGFTGTILIAQNGQALYAGSFGAAERAFDTPARLDTRYPIASITKLFTAAMILQLVETGHLRLDENLGRYLPGYPGAGADRITLRQLLNHTSGLAPFDTVGSYQEAFARGLPNYQRPMTPDDLLRTCCSGPLTGSPGKAFNYNNADYIVLGRIIERATGMPYADALRTRILEPLNLRDTGMLKWDAIVPRLATTYFLRDDTNTLIADMPVYRDAWYAAGATYSTTADLATFADALFGKRLIKAPALRELLTPARDEYGLGLWSYSFKRNGRTHRVAKRPGSIMGANGVLYRLLDESTTIVMLANTNRADLDVFAQRLAEALIDQGLTPSSHRRRRAPSPS